MTFRSWIPSAIWLGKRSFRALQWGHDLSVMDTCTATRQWPMLSAGFNGAMTFRSWIHDAREGGEE